MQCFICFTGVGKSWRRIKSEASNPENDGRELEAEGAGIGKKGKWFDAKGVDYSDAAARPSSWPTAHTQETQGEISTEGFEQEGGREYHQHAFWYKTKDKFLISSDLLDFILT
jgi:hypothetical protein